MQRATSLEPHRGWPSQYPIPCLGCRVLPLPGISVPQRRPGPSADPALRHGLTWQPRRLSRSPALADRDTTCPRGGLYPAPRWGGAKQGGARGPLGRCPTLGSTALPAGGRAAGQMRSAKRRWLCRLRGNDRTHQEGRRGPGRKCRERWRESREMCLHPAGMEPEGWACGS